MNKILIDSREQKNWHIRNGLKQLGYEFEVVKFDTGDYSFVYNGKDYREEFCIERKANWNELKSNLMTKDHKRVKAEFKRAESVDTFIFLIEDQNGIEGIYNTKNYSYKITNSRFKTVFLSFLEHRQYERKQKNLKPIKVIYCHKADTAQIIINEINNYLKDK